MVYYKKLIKKEVSSMNKKKIAIITCIGKNNFGNRLQNYALQKVLQDKGFYVETLNNNWRLNNFDNYEENYQGYLKREKEKEPEEYEKRFRTAYFDEFDENVVFNKEMITAINLENTDYDYYIVGSDQVWNPHHGRLRDVDFLYSIEPSKRISYAASIGVDEIPDNLKEKTKRELSKFKAISVREEKGKEIIENLTGRKDVEVNLDPTMLLTANDWSKLAKKPKQLKTDKYILNYFLGELSDSRKKEIERIAQENNCEIINILDTKSPFYETGPSEFLYLEQNAFLICTDSFHSSVFAIIFNRPFIVFDREDSQASMNSRIDTLLNTFELEDRKYENKITESNLKHDYTKAYEILNEKRIIAHMYLNRVLDTNEN